MNGSHGAPNGEKIVWGDDDKRGIGVNSGGSVKLKFTGKVYGNTGDLINCTAKITNSSIDGSSFAEKIDTATVNIVNSDLTVTKTVSSEKVYYGDTVTYTIEIENNASIDDTIKITDTSDPNKIKNIRNLKVDSKNTTITRPRGSFTISNIAIPAKGKVTIKYDADIYGNIGEKIKNKVTVESNKSGKKEAEAETNTTIEKNVKMGIDGVVRRHRILFAFDVSNSMLPVKWNYYRTCMDFISEIETGIGENFIVGGILYGYDAKFYEREELKKYSNWGTSDSTNYNAALRIANARIDSYDTLVFFSDGLPTFRFWWNFTGWLTTGFDDYGDKMPWRGNAEDFLGRTYDGILDYADKIKAAGKQIYTVGYNVKAEERRGLEAIALPGGYFSASSIDSLFSGLSTVLFADLDLEESYDTENGVIKELKYVDRISKIQIGSTVYEGDGLRNFLNTHLKNRATVTRDGETYQTGNLDLTGISGANDITITFK